MQEDKTLTLLRDARFILSVPERWCRGSLALDKDGKCDPLDRAATAFSVTGALERALLERGYKSDLLDGVPARTYVHEAKLELLPGVPWKEVDARIDEKVRAMTHADLLAWFDVAIVRRASKAPPVKSRGAA